MLTKTKDLIIKKRVTASSQKLKSQTSEEVSLPPTLGQPLRRQSSHISHVNQYNYIHISNKRESLPDKQASKQLELQNFRLIQANMRLTDWTHLMLNKLRDGIRKAIVTIEQFRYLEGVNILYSLLGQLTDYDLPKPSGGLRMSMEAQEHTFRRPHPQYRSTLLLPKLQLQLGVVNFSLSPQKIVDLVIQNQSPSFIKPKLELQEEPVGDPEEVLWRMLLMQSVAIQPYVLTLDGFVPNH